MKRNLHILLLLLLFLPLTLSAQKPVSPKYEYRAVWLTTIENLDWPKTIVRSPSDITEQKNELIVLLDSLKELNVNTVLLQTRVRGDLIYPSRIEPFSHVLTGIPGKDPGYDPLAFAVEECHKRSMQLHAWLVTMPLGKDEHIRRQGKLALSRKKKSLCTRYKGAWYMEPGNPAVIPYLVELVSELVSNYDIDGVHFDYIRYPDRTNGYPDASLYRKYGKGRSLAAWRRDNITRLMTTLYERVKRGDVDQCSFGFDIRSEDTDIREDGSIHWTIREVDLYEVSACTFPSYEETGISARAKERDEINQRALTAWKENARKKLKGE